VEVDTVAALWSSGKSLEAGSLIYPSIPDKARPGWASDILELACSQVPKVPHQVRSVLDIARNPNRWREGHAAFSGVRRLTLAEEKSRSGGKVYETLRSTLGA
jgi:hypothetical protein